MIGERQEDERLDVEAKLRLRAQNAFAVSQAREAVETLWSFYGANAIYTRDPLQRYLRDVQAFCAPRLRDYPMKRIRNPLLALLL